ncbi:AMP-binding protein [Propionibacteriaceae bacterium Y1685]
MPHFSYAGGSDVGPALARALDGGPPVVPLPHPDTDPATLAPMIRPDEPLEDPDCAAIVATSGSTGTAKGVLLSRRAIRAAVAATHDQLGGPGDWVLALPEHYVAGLMVLARALVAGTRTHRVASDLADLATLPLAAPRTYLSVVPTQLVRALDEPTTLDSLTRFDAVLVGGAPMAPALLQRIRDHGVRVVTTYGMSETCGGCVYDGVPLPGVDVRSDPTTTRLSIAGPMLFSGYRCRADLTAEALINGRFITSDRGLQTDGRVQVTGRVDDVVISGGSNVDLAEVERVLRHVLAGHGDGAVIGIPDREWGTRVVAVTDTDLTREDLRSHLSGALLPRQVVHLDVLPRTDSGKIDRQQLVRLLTDDNQE